MTHSISRYWKNYEWNHVGTCFFQLLFLKLPSYLDRFTANWNWSAFWQDIESILQQDQSYSTIGSADHSSQLKAWIRRCLVLDMARGQNSDMQLGSRRRGLKERVSEEECWERSKGEEGETQRQSRPETASLANWEIQHKEKLVLTLPRRSLGM